MNALRPTSYYDERAETVDLAEITSSDDNAEILRRLRDNDPDLAWLSIRRHDDDVFGLDNYFVVREGDDLERLGDLIGRNKVLRRLYIYDMPEYRERITALFIGIELNRSIQNLDICGDYLGESVLSSLSAMLRSESCSLTTLLFSFRNSFSDDMAVALADALKGNKSLKILYFSSASNNLTSVGWSAFSKLLCDTSSVSNIYASNHTLQAIGYSSCQRSDELEQLLALNGLTDKHAAIQKILKYHPDLDVGPFLRDEWELKLLPLVMSWFERIRGIYISQALRNAPRLGPRYDTGRAERIRKISVESEEEIEKRQLSTMYNFVRGMPLVAIDGYRSYSSRKKEEFDLLGRNFIVVWSLLLKE
jgi:hypothetical protein